MLALRFGVLSILAIIELNRSLGVFVGVVIFFAGDIDVKWGMLCLCDMVLPLVNIVDETGILFFTFGVNGLCSMLSWLYIFAGASIDGDGGSGGNGGKSAVGGGGGG